MAHLRTGQLALFETEQSPPRACSADLGKLPWSYSRRSIFESCARKYYYEYYGASRRTAKDDADKEAIRLCKDTSNRFMRTGDLLHLAIGWYLRRARDDAVPSVEQLVGWARKLFDQDRSYSRQHPDGGDIEEGVKYPPVLLQEYRERLVDAEEFCDEAAERLARALVDFATHPDYAAFRVAGTAPDALIERSLHFRPNGVPCRVEGRIDLAYGNVDAATVVDWKLGEETGGADDSLQLAVYALWASEHFGCDASSLRVCRVHFGSGAIVDFPIDESILDAARARIEQDVIRMVAIHDYGLAGQAQAFTPCARPKVCRGCRYLRVCPEGREIA